MPKLTKRFVDNIEPDPQKKLIFWDSDLIGFCVVVLPSGRKTYSAQYTSAHRVKRRIKIGIHGHITPEEARSQAKIVFSKVVQGADPMEKKKPPTTEHKPLFQDLAKEYMRCHAMKKRPKGAREDQNVLNSTLLPTFKDQAVADISVAAIQNLHVHLQETPYQANRGFSFVIQDVFLGCILEMAAGQPCY